MLILKSGFWKILGLFRKGGGGGWVGWEFGDGDVFSGIVFFFRKREGMILATS